MLRGCERDFKGMGRGWEGDVKRMRWGWKGVGGGCEKDGRGV